MEHLTEPRTSVEKLEEHLDRLADVRGDDAATKMLLTTLRSCLPALRKLGYIPTDPAELDLVLLAGARFMLGMRSDHAWQPESIDDLFLGPDPAEPPAIEPSEET